MREIKFRGKTKDGEWVKGSYVYAHKWFVSGKAGHFITSIYGDKRVLVDPETVCQYTGLKDKNGVEIYEGDIVKVAWNTETDIKGVVCFGEADVIVDPFCGAQILGYYVEIANGREETIIKQEQGDKLSLLSSDIFEVIGNIHDNPELLEVEE